MRARRLLPMVVAALCAAVLPGVAPTPASSAPIEPQPVNPVLEAEFEANVREWQARGALAAGAPEGEVRLAPALEGGWVGWCMTVHAGAFHATRCPVAPTTREQVGYESWEAGGSGTRGVALVNARSKRWPSTTRASRRPPCR